MAEPLDTWFKREILSHEVILVRFIARVWPRRNEVADIRQEAYARVYEAARRSRPQTPKAFLFATARHLMADRIRRERIVSIRAGGDGEYLDVLIDEISPEQRVGAHQEARTARAGVRSLVGEVSGSRVAQAREGTVPKGGCAASGAD